MILLPQSFQITKEEDNKATFELYGLYPGYGITLGNSLRRVLLSSLDGAAVTQVKIKGVNHEFSTIPGVIEDVVTIILNLKKIRVRMYGDEPQLAFLKINGEKEVKASDFKTPSQVEIINKDLVIANLSGKKSNLEMEIKIERGTGYEPMERRKKDKSEIGVIHLDASYSPVRKVAFKVENTRVGERTDFDKLIMEIETDGSLEPGKALYLACEVLSAHISVVSRELEEKEREEKEKTEKTKEAEKAKKERSAPKNKKVVKKDSKKKKR